MQHQGRELVLATRPFAREIRWKSWMHMLVGLFLLCAFIVGAFFLPFTWARIVSSICIAAMLVRFFMMFHDFQHHSILRHSPSADFIFTVFGFYMLTPPSIWKRSHDHHHNNNSKLFSASIGSFPIMTRQRFVEADRSERMMYLAVRHPLNMFFAYFTMFIYGMCIQSFLSSARRHWDSLLVLVVHFGIAAFLFIYFGWLTWFLVFFLPFFLAHMLGAYLFYAQHNFPGVVFKNNVEWSYAHAALESSSFMKMNPVMTWVTANIGYHHIHHLNAKIPFYRLPEVMKKIPELQMAKVTTFKVSDIIACLRLKVWDPEQKKMIGFSEMGDVSLAAAS